MFRTDLLWLAPLLAVVCLDGACRSHPRQKPTTRLAATAPTTSPSTRPATRPAMLDICRGIGTFPVATTRPVDSAASLADALRDGFLARLKPARPDFLTVRGDFPSLNLLRVDVSNAALRPDYRPARFEKVTTSERTFTVRRLDYVAQGLHYAGSSARISLTADDARMEIIRDAKNVRGLAIDGARTGRFEFHAAAKDLNRMISFAGDGAHAGLAVLRTTFSCSSDDPHSLTASLDIRARWILLPMTFTLRGRLAASPNGDITFSDLSATGYDPGGLLAAAVLNPDLHEMDGHSQPILSFADPDTHVTDVRFGTTDGLTITVDFGK